MPVGDRYYHNFQWVCTELRELFSKNAELPSKKLLFISSLCQKQPDLFWQKFDILKKWKVQFQNSWNRLNARFYFT
jgi:hypothetical protein